VQLAVQRAVRRTPQRDAASGAARTCSGIPIPSYAFARLALLDAGCAAGYTAAAIRVQRDARSGNSYLFFSCAPGALMLFSFLVSFSYSSILILPGFVGRTVWISDFSGGNSNR